MTQTKTIETLLEELGLGQYASSFQANGITPHNLDTLTDEDLQGIGVSVLGHRKTILKASQPAAPAPPPPTPGAAPVMSQQNIETQNRARMLVNMSSVLGLGGIVALVLLGPWVGIANENWPLATMIMGLGGTSAVVGAIIGQIGRAMQGRII